MKMTLVYKVSELVLTPGNLVAKYIGANAAEFSYYKRITLSDVNWIAEVYEVDELTPTIDVVQGFARIKAELPSVFIMWGDTDHILEA